MTRQEKKNKKNGATVGLMLKTTHFMQKSSLFPFLSFPSFSSDKAQCLLQSCAASRHNQYVGDDDTFADCF